MDFGMENFSGMKGDGYSSSGAILENHMAATLTAECEPLFFKNTNYLGGCYPGQPGHTATSRIVRLMLWEARSPPGSEPVLDVQFYSIPDILDDLLVGVRLGVAPLKLRAEGKVAIFILLNNDGDSIGLHNY